MNTLHYRSYGFILLLLTIGLTACQEDNNFEGVTQLDDHFFLRNDGADMPVAVQGNFEDKAIVVYLHGGPADGTKAISVTEVFNRLEKNFAVAYWDQRATGTAGGTFRTGSLTRKQYVDDLEKLITLVKHRYGDDTKIFLMGISWGGMLGSAYLVKDDNQENISGWIEINGGHDYPMLLKTGPAKLIEIADEQIAQKNSVKDWREIKKFAQDFNPRDLSVRNYARYGLRAIEGENLLYDDDVLQLNTNIEGENKALFNSPLNPVTTIFNNLLARPNYHVTKTVANNSLVNEKLSKIQVPVLLLWGKYDARVSQKVGEDAYQRLGTPEADKKLIVYDKSTHALPYNEPDRFHTDVVQFVEKYSEKRK